jgi:hypothetical protein
LCVPHSSTNTSRSGAISRAPLRQSARFLPRRARRPGGTFFERQPQAREGAADAGGGDRHAVLILEELAVLFEREIGVAQHLPGQRLLQRPALASRGAARRLRIDAPGLAPQPEVAPHAGFGDAEGPRDLLAWHPAVDGGEHPEPEVLRVWFHAPSFTHRSTDMHTAVRARSRALTAATPPGGASGAGL